MPAARFMRRGITKFWFVPTITAGTHIPTAAEVNAGVNVTLQVSEVNGFNFANSPITTPNMNDRFTPQITGEDTAADSNLTLYQLRGGTDTVYAALPKDTAGYMVIFYNGIAGATPAAADKCDVWPATISSRSKMYSAGNEAATYQVVFSITDPPAEDASVAA